MEILLALILCYFLGSFPTAYVAGKVLRGIDITRVGSKNVGGTNIWQTVSRRAAILVSLADIAKGAIAILIAKALSTSFPVQIACGLLAIVGHNWTPFLRFKGGRGMACATGIVLMLAPGEFLAVSPLIVLGFILKNLSLATIVSASALPLFGWALSKDPILALGLTGIPFLMLIKRITANWEPFTPGIPAYSVLINRILLDRDIFDREAWVKRNLLNRPMDKKT